MMKIQSSMIIVEPGKQGIMNCVTMCNMPYISAH